MVTFDQVEDVMVVHNRVHHVPNSPPRYVFFALGVNMIDVMMHFIDSM